MGYHTLEIHSKSTPNSKSVQELEEGENRVILPVYMYS